MSNSFKNVDWLTRDGGRLLWHWPLRAEALFFLKKRAKELTSENQKLLIDLALAGPPNPAASAEMSEVELDQYKRGNKLELLACLEEAGLELPEDAIELLKAARAEQRPGRQCQKEELLQDFAEFTVDEYISWSREIDTERVWVTVGGWQNFASENSAAALTLLVESYERGYYAAREWYALLQSSMDQELEDDEASEDEQNPRYGLLQRICLALTELTPEHKKPILLQASRWLEKGLQHLSEELVIDLWNGLWSAMDPDEAYDPEHNNFDSTLNHESGVLAAILIGLLAKHIPSVNAKDQPGFPKKIEPLFELVARGEGLCGALSRARLIARLLYLYRVNRTWAKENLIGKLADANHPEYCILWQAFLWSAQCTDDLWAEIKEPIIAYLNNGGCAQHDSSERAIELMTAISLRRPELLSPEEFRPVLSGVDTSFLSSVAWMLRDYLIGAGDKSGPLWKEKVGPWIKASWPRSANKKTSETTYRLVWAALHSSDYFDQAIADITPFIGQTDQSGALFLIDHDNDQLGYIEKFPEQVLNLLVILVGDRDPVHDHSLGRALTKIAAAAPELANDLRFIELQRRAAA